MWAWPTQDAGATWAGGRLGVLPEPLSKEDQRFSLFLLSSDRLLVRSSCHGNGLAFVPVIAGGELAGGDCEAGLGAGG